MMGISSFGIMSWKEGTVMLVLFLSLEYLVIGASNPILFGGDVGAALSWFVYSLYGKGLFLLFHSFCLVDELMVTCFLM